LEVKNKIFPSFEEAISDIRDGATIMMHGFAGPGGAPQNLIRAVADKNVKELTLICCNFVFGLTLKNVIAPPLLVENKQVKKAITSVATVSRIRGVSETALERAIRSGEVEVELVPQGTLAERIRAGGAGLGGFYTPVGMDTILAEGKERRVIDGKEYLFELPLRADFGFVRALKADTLGNLIYKGTSRSFNPLIAMAADVTIAEVDDIVETGELDPECIVTPVWLLIV